MGTEVKDITKIPSFQLHETSIRLESAQCHTAQGLAPQLARTQLILMKMEHGDQTQPCVLMLPDIWREIKKFMHL